MERRTVVLALAVAAILALSLGVAQADLKFVGVLRAWDDAAGRFEKGNATLFLDGQPEPFYRTIDFDTAQHANACPSTGQSTQWAGDAEIGLYHLDNNPAGGQGWQSSQDWALVACSLFDDPQKKYAEPSEWLADCSDPANKACKLYAVPNQTADCSTGNCDLEIIIQFHINLDTDCNGAIDDGSNGTVDFDVPGGVCLYWEGIKPDKNATPQWSGEFQARAGVFGEGYNGDKTINFKIGEPTAIKIGNFTASANPGPVSVLALVAGFLLGGAALFLALRKRS